MTCRTGAVAIDVCDRLAATPPGVRATRRSLSASHPYWSCKWELLDLDSAQLDEVESPGEAFGAEATARLTEAAAWLESNSPDTFAELRAAGVFIVVLIRLRASATNVHCLELPPAFLGACGRLGLRTSIDFAAFEDETSVA